MCLSRQTQPRAGARSISALVVVAWLLAAGPMDGSAQIYDPYTPATITGVSGYPGLTELVDATREFGVYGVAWAEQSDIPCSMSLLERRIDDGQNTAARTLDLCGRESGFRVLGLVWVPTGGASRQADFAGAGRRFIRGIQVCANPGNKRMKGVRIFAARVALGDGTVTTVNAQKEAKMPNCAPDEWDDPVYCPAARVATGIVVHYVGRRGRIMNKVTGLSLQCRTLRQEWLP